MLGQLMSGLIASLLVVLPDLVLTATSTSTRPSAGGGMEHCCVICIENLYGGVMNQGGYRGRSMHASEDTDGIGGSVDTVAPLPPLILSAWRLQRAKGRCPYQKRSRTQERD